jgi:hypothetical protein
MRSHIAFFDDSGDANPDNTKDIFVLGVVVIPIAEMKRINTAWWALIRTGLKLTGAPAQLGIEAKWTDVNEYRNRVRKGRSVDDERLSVYRDQKVTPEQIDTLEESIITFIEAETEITLLASAFRKEKYWQLFHGYELGLFAEMRARKPEGKEKQEQEARRTSLRQAVCSKSFEWGVLERVHFLMEDRGNCPCIIIGDSCSAVISANWHQGQDRKQTGSAPRYTDAPNVVTNVAFGSSIHSPGLQLADWVASGVRRWALGRSPDFLRRWRPRFRGAENPTIAGGGLVLKPARADFPPIPGDKN